jgi:sulfate permease, SulP family
MQERRRAHRLASLVEEATPKLVRTMREGYGLAALRADALAGLTVAIVALPLAMALAMASGTTPDKGIVTAIVAGFLISALGGSRFQIGGPTGAFVAVVVDVTARHGYDGLLLATLMAGVILTVAGLLRWGQWIKYIPEPVIVGFTSGIGVIIMTSQIKDVFGLSMTVPNAFHEKWGAFWQARATVNVASAALGLSCVAALVLARRFAPKAPAFLVVTALASCAVALCGWQTETIGSRFGGIPHGLPWPAWPQADWSRVVTLLPSALTIAFLAGLESLLSAVVADGMTGRRHRPNAELLAQGVANIASALMGGLPATGAIARTVTNVRSGARTPVAGMLHAVFLLLFVLAFADFASYAPLATLSAVLVVVAWNMADPARFLHVCKTAPFGDRAALLLAFGLTLLADLTIAIEASVIVSAVLFMHRMAEQVRVHDGRSAADEDPRAAEGLPPDVALYRIEGPIFFGATHKLMAAFDRTGPAVRVLILDMSQAPLLDATGAEALRMTIERLRKRGGGVIFVGTRAQPAKLLHDWGLEHGGMGILCAPTLDEAKRLAHGNSFSASPH